MLTPFNTLSHPYGISSWPLWSFPLGRPNMNPYRDASLASRELGRRTWRRCHRRRGHASRLCVRDPRGARDPHGQTREGTFCSCVERGTCQLTDSGDSRCPLHRNSMEQSDQSRTRDMGTLSGIFQDLSSTGLKRGDGLPGLERPHLDCW